MKKSMIAGAVMVAAAAVAVPVIGWSQSPPPPASAGAPGPGGPGGDHMGGPMHHEWAGRMMAWRNKSPQQACVDRLARHAGLIASIGFKLNLTSDQQPLWDKLVSVTQNAEDAQRKLCDALPANAQDRDKLTAIDRLHHREQVLQAKLQAMQQADPAVQALYDKLTPAQKEVLDHPFKRG